MSQTLTRWSWRPCDYDDRDNDRIYDYRDNCINVRNFSQADFNGDGEGDRCDDTDEDGILDYLDNCREHANREQADWNGDKIGDRCQNSIRTSS